MSIKEIKLSGAESKGGVTHGFVAFDVLTLYCSKWADYGLEVMTVSDFLGYKRSLLGVWYSEGEWFVDLFWVHVYSGSSK